MYIREEYIGTGVDNKEAALRGDWWGADKSEMSRHVHAVVKTIRQDQSELRQRHLRHARMYSNREFRGFGRGEHAKTVTGPRANRLSLNVVKSCVDTVASKIAKNKPRALFLTSGGDWDLQEKGKLLTKFCDGLFDAANVYEIAQRVFVDACVYGTGALHVFVDQVDNRIKCERVRVDEHVVDEEEGRDQAPRQMHVTKLIAKSRLRAMFPKKLDQIAAAKTVDENGAKSTGDRVEVVFSWHLPSGRTTDDEGKPVAHDGVHTISIDTADGVLWTGPYTKDYFPVLFLRWSPGLDGFYGIGLAEELTGLQVEINRVLTNISRAIAGAVPRIFIDNVSSIPKDHITDEVWQTVRFNGRPPIFSPTAAMDGGTYQYLENLYRKAYEITGVSMLAATSKKPAGLDSGEAIREYNDIETERFLLTGLRYEQFFMQIARCMVDLARDAANDDRPIKVRVRDGKEAKQIDWKEIDLQDTEYLLRIFPVSFLPTTPAARLQFVKELVKEGFIQSREQALTLLDYPDLEEFISLQVAAVEDIKAIIQDVLDGGPVTPPDKWMNLELAEQMAHSAILRGRRNGRPKAQLERLMTWADQVAQKIADLAPPPAPPGPALPPGPGAPPPGGPMPPPGDPSMPMAA